MRIEVRFGNGFRAIGENFPHRDCADNTDKSATILAGAGDKPGAGPEILRNLRKIAQPSGEDFARAGVIARALQFSSARPTCPSAKSPRQGDLS